MRRTILVAVDVEWPDSHTPSRDFDSEFIDNMIRALPQSWRAGGPGIVRITRAKCVHDLHDAMRGLILSELER